MYERGRIMTEEERKDIIQWVCNNFFQFDMVRGYTKLKYVFSIYDKTVPAAIWRIKNRIIHKENMYDYMPIPIFTDLVLVNTTGGSTPPHMDPNLGDFKQIRFNVGIMIPKTGSKTVYDGKPVVIKEGHYALCRAGMDIHSVDVNTSEHPRILLSYGFCVPSSKVTGNTVLAASNTKDSVQEIGDTHFNRNPINTEYWPTPVETLNFIVSKALIYGLTWWKTGRLFSDVTVRQYLDEHT